MILVVNCGSSSIKYQVFRMDSMARGNPRVAAKGLVEKIGEDSGNLVHSVGEDKHEFPQAIPDHKAGMRTLLGVLTDREVGVMEDIHVIKAVGHRVVHGGEAFSDSVMIDEAVLAAIKDFADLAPLHNPPNLTGIEAATHALPGVPQVAVFDTAFHQSIPRYAFIYGLPYEFYTKHRVRRYGFHGTSHAYVSRRAADLLGKKPSEINVITCHLGNGCSITAVRGGKSVDTSMGLTPLEGLVMGTRCGDIDPAIIFYLENQSEDYNCQTLNTILNKQSGLLGISGVSNDMRELKDAAAAETSGSERACLAIDVFAYRIRKYVGSYMAVLGNVDAVVFTGGIGENNADTRHAVLSGMEALGITLDDAANERMIRGNEGDVAAPGSPTRVLVIPTDEEGFIASETYRLVAGS